MYYVRRLDRRNRPRAVSNVLLSVGISGPCSTACRGTRPPAKLTAFFFAELLFTRLGRCIWNKSFIHLYPNQPSLSQPTTTHQCCPPATMAPVRRAPYKDFLQPALHRRFTSTATILLAIAFVEAVVLASWDSREFCPAITQNCIALRAIC